MLQADPQNPGLALAFGLTGGIACGKSTVAGLFRELGAYLIDADRLGHELMEPGQPSHQEIVAHFGREILDLDGRIDRKKLGPRVFAEPRERLLLNAILHPRVIARAHEWAAAELRRNPHAVVIFDAPLIFESGLGARLRKVMVVWCRPEQQLARLMSKTGIAREEAERRMHAQMPTDEKVRLADYRIDCSGTLDESRAQASALYPELRRIAESLPDFR